MSAQEKSLISPGIPPSQGYAIFKTALDQSPDIISLIQSIAKTEPKELIALRKAKNIQKEIRDFHHKHRPASSHKYGVNERFASRPTSAPGPGQYIQHRMSPQIGWKMQSRYETTTEITPGPQSYLVTDVRDSTLGIMTREAKYKDNAEFYQTFLGPGSYEMGTTLNDTGWKFAKEGRDSELDVSDRQPTTGLKQRHEQRPGPGQYTVKTESSGRAFSIPKSQGTHKKTQSLLGPGSYTVVLPKDSQDFKFSSVPRFAETFHERMESDHYSDYQPRHRRKSVEELKAEKDRFEHNKDVSKWKKAARRKSLEDQGTQRDLKLSIAYQTRAAILLSEKLRKRIAYEAKMQRYHFRMRKEVISMQELAEVQVSWLICATFASSLCDLNRGYLELKVGNMQDLHRRSEALLKRLKVLCMALGKFCCQVRNIRKRRSIIVNSTQMLNQIIPFIGRWRRRRKKRLLELISHVLGEAVLGKIIFKIMQQWMMKIDILQKHGKAFVVFRRGHYAVAKSTWEYLEKSSRKEPTPEKVKEFFLCLRYRRRCREYLMLLSEYYDDCNAVNARNKRHKLDAEVNRIAGMESEVIMEKITRAKPTLHYHINHEEMKELIAQAFAKKDEWGNIVKAMMPPLLKMSTGTRTKGSRHPTLPKGNSTDELLRALYYSKLSYPAKGS